MKRFFKRHKGLLMRIGVLLLIVLFYHCPFRWIFGMDCPGCGMTRALLSALKLDFQAAFSYHPLFWLFGPIFFYLLFYEYIGKWIKINDKIENAVLIGSMLLLLIVWVFRQFII